MADALSFLTGERVVPVLERCVSPDAVLGWRVRQVDHRPRSGTTVSYRLRVQGSRGERSLTVGATTSPVAEAPGVIDVETDIGTVAVWRFPRDPALPGLASVASRKGAVALLRRCGLPPLSPEDIVVSVRSYRPRRRAVLEVRVDQRRVFVKVVRPAAAEDLQRRHDLLVEAGLPVPRVLAPARDGVVAVAGLPGVTMRTSLHTPDHALPSARELLALLDAMPVEVMELPHRPPWSDNAPHYASIIGAALPEEAERAADLADEIIDRIAGHEPEVPTHGDFYENQILLSLDGHVSGLLDVDTVGPGRRADDLACLLAHGDVLASRWPEHRRRLRTQVRSWTRRLGRTVDPDELAVRTAGVLLSLATGPHRVREDDWERATTARLDLAERWLTTEL